MTPRLVGLAGPAGAGKSSAAALLAAEGGWRVASFADPLRTWALELHPEWALLDLLGNGKDAPRPPGPLGWGRVEDIVIRHAADLTGEDVADRFPQILADAVSELQQTLSPRATLRMLGDTVRAIDPQAFVARAAERIECAGRAGESTVIDDVRFESEAAMVRERGGIVVHVQRDGVRYRRDHNSECGIRVTPEDRLLVNHGNLAALRAELVAVLHPRYRAREVFA